MTEELNLFSSHWYILSSGQDFFLVGKTKGPETWRIHSPVTELYGSQWQLHGHTGQERDHQWCHRISPLQLPLSHKLQQKVGDFLPDSTGDLACS